MAPPGARRSRTQKADPRQSTHMNWEALKLLTVYSEGSASWIIMSGYFLLWWRLERNCRWQRVECALVIVQLLSRVLLFVTPWTAARQASTSFTISQNSAQTQVHWISDAIQPSNPLAPPSPPALNHSQHQSLPVSWLFESGGQSIGASASTPAF